MSLSNEERDVIVRMQLEKSDRFMFEAETVAGMNMWNLVANRLYYSVFHAVAGVFVHDICIFRRRDASSFGRC